MDCRRVVVRGRVQGVFFRASLQEAARRAGVVGWTRNREDGTVEAHLEGPGDAVAEVLAFCRRGPPGARVEGVEEGAASPEGLSDFAIRR